MNRWDIAPPDAASMQPPPPPSQVPPEFMEAMKRLNPNGMSVKPQLANQGKSSVDKWKSSFKPLGGEVVIPDPEKQGTESSENWNKLYDPYSPLSSDSEMDLPKSKKRHIPSPQCQDKSLEPEQQSVHVSRGQDSAFPESGGQPTDTPTPEPQSLNGPGYGSSSVSAALDQRGCSPDRHLHSASTQSFPPLYGGPRTNGEERIAGHEYRREIAATVRLSPPRIQRDYQRELPYTDTGVNRAPSPTNVTRNRSKVAVMNKTSITCDLCDVFFANGHELCDHLDSKIHWDTLEHIQQINNYDDVAIAFLQEVMLYKSHQCSRAIEDSALQALQVNNHMTKLEMFHCAACKVFVSTSAAEVHSHITSPEHMSNNKDFDMQQRHTCLSKAETMMQELQPQLQLFMEGGTPFGST